MAASPLGCRAGGLQFLSVGPRDSPYAPEIHLFPCSTLSSGPFLERAREGAMHPERRLQPSHPFIPVPHATGRTRLKKATVKDHRRVSNGKMPHTKEGCPFQPVDSVHPHGTEHLGPKARGWGGSAGEPEGETGPQAGASRALPVCTGQAPGLPAEATGQAQCQRLNLTEHQLQGRPQSRPLNACFLSSSLTATER